MKSGIGCQALALKYLGADFEYWKTSDWDTNACASYKAIHHGNDDTDYSFSLTQEEVIKQLVKWCISTDGKAPMTEDKIRRKGEKWQREVYNNFKASHNLGSITGVHAEDLKIDEDKACTIMSYSFPCVTGNTLIKTDEGYKPIKDIEVGDKVLTHTGKYKKVLKTMHRISDHINHLDANGISNLEITDEHPMYVLKDNEVKWIKVNDLKEGDLIAFNQTEEIKAYNTKIEGQYLGWQFKRSSHENSI